MKTILLVVALAFTITLSGNASNVTSVTKSQTENSIVSKTTSSSTMKSGKSKKAHHGKKTHKNSASKKAK